MYILVNRTEREIYYVEQNALCQYLLMLTLTGITLFILQDYSL